MPEQRQALKRFSAALLFQSRVVVDGCSGQRRTCEKRIIHFEAVDARTALRHAKKRARQAQHCCKNSQGNPVHFEFVGVCDLLCCDHLCEPDEVWYEIVEMITPMERRDKLIPPESELCAILNRD